MRLLTRPLYRYLETRVHPLRYLFLEITRRCNLRCRHCGSDCSSEPQPDELSAREWVRLLDDLGQQPGARRLLLVLTGGEPLCHPELPSILDALRRNGFTWGIVTNGMALSGRRLASLRQTGLYSLTLSVDGLRQSHDWLRGQEGAFGRALEAVGLLARQGPPVWDVVTCANPTNLPDLPGLHDLLRREGVPAWRIFTIFPRGRARSDPGLLLDAAGMRALVAWLTMARAEAGTGTLRPSYGCEGYLPAEVDRAVRDDPYFCLAGISIASVLADGAIGACPNIDRSLTQGNVREDNLLTVWEERFAPFRDRAWMRTGACSRCREWRRCQGNSLHLWDAESGTTALCHHGALCGGH